MALWFRGIPAPEPARDNRFRRMPKMPSEECQKYNDVDQQSAINGIRPGSYRDQQNVGSWQALRLKSTSRFKSIFSIEVDCRATIFHQVPEGSAGQRRCSEWNIESDHCMTYSVRSKVGEVSRPSVSWVPGQSLNFRWWQDCVAQVVGPVWLDPLREKRWQRGREASGPVKTILPLRTKWMGGAGSYHWVFGRINKVIWKSLTSMDPCRTHKVPGGLGRFVPPSVLHPPLTSL